MRRWEFPCVVLICYVWLFSLRPYALFYIFQERDLERARLLTQGHFIFFGPEASGGGHLPGGFYYYLLALPLSLGLKWEGCWYLMNGLGSLAVGWIWLFLRRYFCLEAALVACLYLFSMPMFFKTFGYFENPSYLPFFLIAAYLGFARAFAAADQRAWLWACLAIGLGLQLHFAIFFVLFAGLVLQILAPYLSLQRLPVKSFCSGLAVLFASMGPFFAWQIFRQFGIFLGQSSPALQGTVDTGFRQLRQGMARSVPLTQVVSQLSFWDFFLVLSLPMALVILACVILSRPQKRKDSATFEWQALKVWLVCLSATAIPAATVVMLPNRPRYLIPFAFCLPLIAGAWMHLRLNERARLWRAFVLLAHLTITVLPVIGISRLGVKTLPFSQWPLGLMLASFVFALIVFCFSMTRLKTLSLVATLAFLPVFMVMSVANLGRPGKGLTTLESAAMARTIVFQTGWSWEEARRRLFFVNVHYQRSPFLVYRDTAVPQIGQPAPHLVPPPDGYIVASYMRKPHGRFQNGFLPWLLKQELATELDRGLRTGAIRLGEAVVIGKASLAPYYVMDKLNYPEKFQNYGIHYNRELSRANSPGPQTAERLGPGHVRFAFNDCPALLGYCETRFEIQRYPEYLHVELSGEVLSQASTWFFPDWNQGLHQPYISLQCTKSSAAVKIPLTDWIGFSNKARITHVMNDRVLAPFERRISNPCAGAIYRIGAGYEDSMSLIERQFGFLPGRALALENL